MTKQYTLSLGPYSGGIYLITDQIVSKLKDLPQYGLLNVFIKHTSAALTINENADPSVRVDMENYLDRLVKENENYYTHVYEGADDMPAHIKSSIIGSSINIPISNHKLNMGIWQGIYLLEFRNYPSERDIICTVI